MSLFDELLLAADAMFLKCEECKDPGKCTCSCAVKNTCRECLSDIFWVHKERTYKCNNITVSYLCCYLNRYSSEIAVLFQTLHDMGVNPAGGKILSIGSGPSTEVVALNYAHENLGLFPDGIKYYGFDPNRIWKPLNALQKDLCDRFCDSLELHYYYKNFDIASAAVLSNFNIVILNYLLSDIYVHNGNKELSEYLAQIKIALPNMRKGSLLIINDVNSCYEGRDQIESFGRELQQIDEYEVGGFYFENLAHPEAHFSGITCNYKYQNSRLLFSTPETISDRFDPTGSVNKMGSSQLVIRKR
jgi:hypothetical protein